MTNNMIVDSFELAAGRCDDLTPLVYARLFGEHPELEQFFVMDPTGAVRGSMLAWVINAILDYAGARSFGENLIRAEAVTHTGMGVAPEQFGLFFGAVADTLRELLGADWTAEIDQAWGMLLGELAGLVQRAG